MKSILVNVRRKVYKDNTIKSKGNNYSTERLSSCELELINNNNNHNNSRRSKGDIDNEKLIKSKGERSCHKRDLVREIFIKTR